MGGGEEGRQILESKKYSIGNCRGYENSENKSTQPY